MLASFVLSQYWPKFAPEPQRNCWSPTGIGLTPYSQPPPQNPTSQVHDPPGLHGETSAITWLKGADERSNFTPIFEAADFQAWTSWLTIVSPVAYSSLNSSLSPWFTPVPQLPLQTLTPSGLTVQPCDLSSAAALVGLYLYGVLFVYALTYGFGGCSGTGALVGQP